MVAARDNEPPCSSSAEKLLLQIDLRMDGMEFLKDAACGFADRSVFIREAASGGVPTFNQCLLRARVRAAFLPARTRVAWETL
jgi:hypothetical protein